MKSVFVVLALLVCAGSAHAAPPSPLPLAWCLERALQSNPEIAAERATSEAARTRVGPAGSLDDPRLSYDISNVPRDDRNLRSTPLSGQQFGLRQKLPFPGLLESRKQAADADARAASHRVHDRELRVLGAVESAWAELGFAQRALAITERNIELLRKLAAIAESKYRVGSGLQQDVLRAQVELTALLRERLQRAAAVDAAAARLAALLDLPAATAFPATAALADAAPVPDVGVLLPGIEEKSARLAALRERVAAAERALRAVELESYPDFDLGLGYRVRKRVAGDAVKGDDFLSAGVTVRLPVDRSKWRARIAERRALVRRARAEQQAGHLELAAELRTAHAMLVRADSEQALLRTGLVPQAEQSLESSRSGYEVGRVDFLSLLDSQVQLLDAELRLVRAQADRRQAFAALETAAGEKLR